MISPVFSLLFQDKHLRLVHQGLTTQPPDTSDAALSGWIDEMLTLYVQITKRDVKFSKVKEEEAKAGEPVGPLIRFLTEAGKPIGIELSPYSLARRIETAKEHHARKKQ